VAVAQIRLEQITKVFPDGTKAVAEVDLEIPDGAFVVLVGPSGCGKTTLLRMVAGLEQPTGGQIRIGDVVVNDMPPKKRDIAMVFQNYALYPHMSVYDNMAFALRRRREPKALIDRRVTHAAGLLGLTEQLKKKPGALSGGQRQRVAMGRAIVRQPQAFLMDEPLSNLDAKLRVEMRAEISRIQAELGVTTIFVTHDQTEAMTMGDLVAVMRGGVVQQLDTPEVLFSRPSNLFVAGFVGSPAMNLVKATVRRNGSGLIVTAGRLRLQLDDELLARRPALAAYEDREIALGIRPEDMEDARFTPDAPAETRLPIAVELRENLGREAYLHFTLDAEPAVTAATREIGRDTDAIFAQQLEQQAADRRSRLIARVNARTTVKEGEQLELALDTKLLDYFDLDSGASI
jgi:multiple sugar transport system ATP-binding protein